MNKEPILYVITFCLDGCFGIISLCIPLLALTLGASYDDLGSIGALDAFVYSVSCLFSGRLADRWGHRRTAAAATFLSTLIYVLYTQVSSLNHIFLLAACHGFAFSGFWPSVLAWLGQGKSPAQLLQTIGRFNVAWSVGVILGPLLGGTLYAFHPMVPFWLSAGLASLVTLTLILLPRLVTAEAPSDTSELEARPGARRFLMAAWVANFATYFTLASIRHLFPKYATDLGIAPGRLGLLLGCIGIAQLIAFVLLARTTRWQFRFIPLAGGQAVGILGLGCVVVGHTPLVFGAGLLLIGVAVGITYSASLYYSLHTTDQAGGRTGVHEAIIGAGFLFGPLIGGFAAEHIGSRVPYVLAASISLVAILIEYGLLQRSELKVAS